MLKILLLISLITGAITAVVDYLKTDDTQQTIEQIKENK